MERPYHVFCDLIYCPMYNLKNQQDINIQQSQLSYSQHCITHTFYCCQLNFCLLDSQNQCGCCQQAEQRYVRGHRKFPVKRVFWIIQCQIIQLLLCQAKILTRYYQTTRCYHKATPIKMHGNFRNCINFHKQGIYLHEVPKNVQFNSLTLSLVALLVLGSH